MDPAGRPAGRARCATTHPRPQRPRHSACSGPSAQLRPRFPPCSQHLIQIAGRALYCRPHRKDRRMQEQKIYGRRDGAVGHLVFNNPAKLNAVSLDMWDGFVGILKDYAKDPEIRCVVVSGAGGKAFVSGADISKFESERANAEAQVRYDAISKEGYESLYNFPKPTIAKITGYCIGGGMNLAACRDPRHCNAGARVGVPAAQLGLGFGV